MTQAASRPGALDEARRVELILRRVETLPTLPEVATRLLDLTARDDAEASDIINLVRADPALTSRILAMCRTADKGVRGEVLNIDKAVMLLGFKTVRNAVLSLQIGTYFEKPTETADKPVNTNEPALDRQGLWIHSLAVAITAELIAETYPERKGLRPDQAFVCGLLHDIGKLALDYVLPRSYGKVLLVAQEHQAGLAEIENRVLGMDHHTAGKRLADCWKLPDLLTDTIWQHGLPPEAFNEHANGPMLKLIALANEIVRSLRLGDSGNHHRKSRLNDYAQAVGIPASTIDNLAPRIVRRLEELSLNLGVGESKPSVELLLDAVRQANDALARANRKQQAKPTVNPVAERTLKQLQAFQNDLNARNGLTETLGAVARSVSQWAQGNVHAAWFAGEEDRQGLWDGAWFRFDENHQPITSGRTDSPDDFDPEAVEEMWGVPACEAVPWLAKAALPEASPAERLLVIGQPHEPCALFLIEAPRWPRQEHASPLLTAWGQAIAASAAYERSRQLNEEVVRVSTQLSDAQDELVKQRSMARLGEVTAGAAHEMNNPLTVISGRAQLLAMRTEPGSDLQKSAQLMVVEAQKLTDLITSLHLLAKPPAPTHKKTDLGHLIQQAAGRAREAVGKKAQDIELSLQIPDELPDANVDADQVRQALIEIIRNAFEAPAATEVRVTLELAPGGRRALIRIRDDGPGMDLHTLEHAFDPFFSAKPSGRRVGMGLSKARTFINGHDGRLDLDSAPGQGTTALIALPLDRRS
ncbi:HDOD domain-containing protein [Mucisphaera sp.]|uniref:HDOD domain-containing protein n=1 Tax=Mucisphaera sp. TaxID=2913024 RepID=UPI003D09F745